MKKMTGVRVSFYDTKDKKNIKIPINTQEIPKSSQINKKINKIN